MSNRREDLDDLLVSICPNVYYQPPESVRMTYPCIVYSRNVIDSKYADNNPYFEKTAYSMRYITKDPDDPVVYELARLPKCKHTSHYAKDNLHHDAYTIYY